jgi:hypothetical protein
MQDRFTVFIDESGEAGIEKVRSETSGGASPYMTLGASLINNASRSALEQELLRITEKVGKKSLHCSKLNHYQILYFIQEITKHRMRLFGLVSRKDTLGSYKKQISENSSMYYNKCCQYLMERIGFFMQTHGISPDKLDIIFENSNNDYGKMRNFLKTCQANPHQPVTRLLRHIDVDNIKIKDKTEEPLLEIADLVAHALYRCVDKSTRNLGITEPRYINELAPNFFGHPDSGTVLGAGLHCVHSVRDLKADAHVAEMFTGMRSGGPEGNWPS